MTDTSSTAAPSYTQPAPRAHLAAAIHAVADRVSSVRAVEKPGRGLAVTTFDGAGEPLLLPRPTVIAIAGWLLDQLPGADWSRPRVYGVDTGVLTLVDDGAEGS